MKSQWSCYCGKLNRLKFRQIVCKLCRTECLIKEPSLQKRHSEMAKWLNYDYAFIGQDNAIRLICHHFWLLEQCPK